MVDADLNILNPLTRTIKQIFKNTNDVMCCINKRQSLTFFIDFTDISQIRRKNQELIANSRRTHLMQTAVGCE
jgi:hypothetical protein